MTLKAYKFNVGDIEYDVLKCEGEGQWQCKRCKDRGIYNVSWTSWFYKLNKDDKGVLCSDCLREILIQNRVAEARKETVDKFAEKLKTRFTKSREYYEIDTGTAWSDGCIGGLINDTIDKIVKEFTEAE